MPHLETFRLVSATREKPAHSHEFARPSLQALSTGVGRYIGRGDIEILSTQKCKRSAAEIWVRRSHQMVAKGQERCLSACAYQPVDFLSYLVHV